MATVNRRAFLAATASATAFGATGALRAAVSSDGTPTAATNSESDRPPAPPMIKLGKTGIEMSRLGQGTGVHG
ncbi:MAG TPA: hypothetical protein VH107_17635, partial [Lacipirellulaceae bacterium]|nr:hypothetical protein [Lacipirellulaceae bacterium]